MSTTRPETLRDAVTDLKPKLRGWLHAAIAPLAFFSFLVLLVLADSVVVRAGAAVFMFSAVLLFGVSAVYHTGRWSDRAKEIWRRFDHANIFILIAGSYTPFSLLILKPTHAAIMLSLVWGGALLGVFFRIFWVNAPRWLYVRRILVPGSLPFIITGLRLTYGVGWRVIIGAEMISSIIGIGFMIDDARWQLRPDIMIAGMITIAIIGLVTENWLFDFIERRTLDKWGMKASGL